MSAVSGMCEPPFYLKLILFPAPLLFFSCQEKKGHNAYQVCYTPHSELCEASRNTSIPELQACLVTDPRCLPTSASNKCSDLHEEKQHTHITTPGWQMKLTKRMQQSC